MNNYAEPDLLSFHIVKLVSIRIYNNNNVSRYLPPIFQSIE